MTASHTEVKLVSDAISSLDFVEISKVTDDNNIHVELKSLSNEKIHERVKDGLLERKSVTFSQLQRIRVIEYNNYEDSHTVLLKVISEDERLGEVEERFNS